MNENKKGMIVPHAERTALFPFYKSTLKFKAKVKYSHFQICSGTSIVYPKDSIAYTNSVMKGIGKLRKKDREVVNEKNIEKQL